MTTKRCAQGVLLALCLSIAVLAGLASPVAGRAAVNQTSGGEISCWGGTTTAHGPTVYSSGHVAWYPVFLLEEGGSSRWEWGEPAWAYRDSAWRSFRQGNLAIGQQNARGPVPAGGFRAAVYNWIYDYDTRSWSGTWSFGLYRDPLTGRFARWGSSPWCSV